MTFIAALRPDRIDAPFVFEQPINAQSFTAWIEQQLAPTLAFDIVVMDNSPATSGPPSRPRSAPEARGCRSSRPDLDPIEQVFAKLEHLPRKAAQRTHEATWRRIGNLRDAVPPHECANYLRNSGYASR